MNAAADHEHGLVRRRDPTGILRRKRPRVGEPLVVRPDLGELRDVLRRADDGGDGRVALGRRTDVHDRHAIRTFVNQREVSFDISCRSELPIRPHPKSKMRLRGWYLGGGPVRGTRLGQRQNREEQATAPENSVNCHR